MDNKQKIQGLVLEMLNESFEEMKIKAIEVINNGLVNTDNWSEFKNPFMLPKTIVCAVLENQSVYYIDFEKKEYKKQREEINNIKCFI